MQLDEIAAQCLEDSLNWFPETTGDLGFLTIAMLGEAGEFANYIKKGMRGDYSPDDVEFQAVISEELTDVFIYMMNIFGAMGWDLEEMYKRKRAINVERFGKATRDDGAVQ